MEIIEIIRKASAGKNLTTDEAAYAMECMMAGSTSAKQMGGQEAQPPGSFTPAQAAGLLIALKMKGETVEEITEFARVMRRNAVNISPNVDGLVDTCGTGGDSSHTFNVSTTAALIAAGAGVPIAKHGNRSVSGKCGSADVLEQLGVKMLQPKQAKECIEKVGFGFMFAPYFHPAMKNVMPVRKELGVRTVFNILGPLTNPAGAKRQVLGVFDASLAEKMAKVLLMLGAEHALVVHSSGIDEIGLGKTEVHEVKDGKIRRADIDASTLGFEKLSIPTVQTKEESAAIVLEVLSGKEGAARDAAVLNAAAAIYVGGKAKDIADGVGVAKKAIDSGAAMGKLEQLKGFTGE